MAGTGGANGRRVPLNKERSRRDHRLGWRGFGRRWSTSCRGRATARVLEVIVVS